MRVAELAIVLDHVDPDLLVIVPGHGRAVHLDTVDHRPRRRDRWARGTMFPEHVPATLVLRGDISDERGWWEPEPADLHLLGAFRRRAELERRLR